MKAAAQAARAYGANNAAEQRILNEVQAFTGWLGGARGVITEIGWPNAQDTQCWNRVVQKWVRAYANAGVPVLFFVAQGWGVATGLVTMFTRTSGNPSTPTDISQAYSNALPVLHNLATAGGTWRGIHMFGPDANDGGGSGNASVYNNTLLGTLNTSGGYWYETQGSYDYLASLGATMVRVPFKWERLQHSLNATLNAAELARLQAAVTAAGNAGLKVVLDCHSYAQYMFASGRFPVGKSTDTIPASALADLWTKVSAAFSGNPAVQAYSLMNEPHDVPLGINGEPPAKLWEAITQQVVNAIRANSDTTEIHVPGYEWAHAPFFPKNHPNGPWITDTANNVRYDAHHYLYFGRGTPTNYPDSFSTELTGCTGAWSHYMGGRTWATLAGATWGQV